MTQCEEQQGFGILLHHAHSGTCVRIRKKARNTVIHLKIQFLLFDVIVMYFSSGSVSQYGIDYISIN